MNTPFRVTHRDIAQRIGCDKSTVSLALHGSTRVTAAVRLKIQTLAREMGYKPDPALAMLARERWARQPTGTGTTLAYLVNRKQENHHEQLQHLEAIKRQADERGCNLTVFDLSIYPSGGAASNVLYNRGIRCLILPALQPDSEPHLRGFEWAQFTVVRCAAGTLELPFHLVTADTFGGTVRAWQEVLQRDYRRIGVVLDRHSHATRDDLMRQGACCLQQMQHVPPRDRIAFFFCEPGNRDSFLFWLERHCPEVVIGLEGQAHKWLHDAGYGVPQDVAFVGLDVSPRQGLTGMVNQVEKVGAATVDFLITQMQENQWGIPCDRRLVLLAPEWQEGNTLPACGARTLVRESQKV